MTTSINQFLVSHWARPRGAIGRFAGWEMAHGKGATNELVTRLLEPGPADRVVEVGFGPGVAVEHLAGTVSAVAGVDHSEVMLAQALRRNRDAALAGRVDLRLGTAEHLPWEDGSFTKALTLNSIGFWPDPEAGLHELARVLRPGGRLLIGMRRGRDRAGALTDLLKRTGFQCASVSEHEPPGLAAIVAVTA